MSFGQNVVYYRKQKGITQEELADTLFVSRQTVSRWENDSAFPDVEMIIRLCDIFGCDMDTLVRGNAEINVFEKEKTSSDNEKTDNSKYDKHMNSFALFISIGVALIILGVALTVLLCGFPNGELFAIITLFVCLAFSVADFIFCGINYTNFMRENPKIEAYPEYRFKSYLKKFAWFITIATVLIFLGVILLIIMNYNDNFVPQGFELELWQHLSVAIFLFIVSISTFLYVYSGILYSKYNVKEYNAACVKEGFATSEEEMTESSKKTRINDAVSSVIMLTATGVFLLLGFLKNLWHPAWVVFPVGGILCGICSVIFDAVFKDK